VAAACGRVWGRVCGCVRSDCVSAGIRGSSVNVESAVVCRAVKRGEGGGWREGLGGVRQR